MRRKANKAVILSCLGAAAVCAALFCAYIFDSASAHDLCADICMYGWERYITYPMLSAELREIVSEEEFSDRSPEGKLRMYEKLVVLDDRANDKFGGRTSWFKTPCYDLVDLAEAGGECWVELSIDVVSRFGKTEVRNFTACVLRKGWNEE